MTWKTKSLRNVLLTLKFWPKTQTFDKFGPQKSKIWTKKDFFDELKKIALMITHSWSNSSIDNEWLWLLHDTKQQLHSEVHADARLYHTLREEAAMLDHVLELLAEYRSQRQQGGPLSCQTWTLPSGGQSVSLFTAANRKNSSESSANASSTFVTSDKYRAIRSDDDSKSRPSHVQSLSSSSFINAFHNDQADQLPILRKAVPAHHNNSPN